MKFTELERSVRALAPLLSECRRKRIAEVVKSRTGSLAVLLDDVWDEGNRNAVMRTMDAFGVHKLYSIKHVAADGRGRLMRKKKKIRTDAGARNWVVRRVSSDVEECVRELKSDGYIIAATTPDATKSLLDVDFSSQPIVVAFGNEHEGISDSLLRSSDLHFSIPMNGFAESLNISVCVAVTLFQAHSQRLAKLVGVVSILSGNFI